MFIRSHFLFALLAAAFFASSLIAPAYEPPAAAAPRPFDYPDDTFSFKNETKWNYVGGTVQAETRPGSGRDYTGRCMVLARASVQFWKFARFEPDAKPLGADELAHRIREVCARSVWLPAFAPRDRIVIPGYRDLREASAKMPLVFEANIGCGWPFYFRAGNIVIATWVSRAMEDRLNGRSSTISTSTHPPLSGSIVFPA